MGRLAVLVMAVSTGAVAGAPLSPLVEELLPRVVKVMGLPLPRPVKVRLISRAEAEALLRQGPSEDAARLARLGEALVAIGLLPAQTKLEALAPDFERQNVAGFYELRRHTLFLLADQPDEAQRPIIAHELAHAVQDANVDLDAALTARRGSEDAVLAFTAVLEGQAQATAALVMDGWLREQHVAVEGLAGLLSDTTARSAAEAAEHAPVPWLGLQLRYPYVAGRALIDARSSAADPIARGLLAHPPASTAQVRSAGEAPPLQAAFHLERLLPRARPALATTLGQANVELLGEGLGEGWRGDRLESVRVGGKTVVVWAVKFEEPAQAERLVAALAGRGTLVREGALVGLLCGVDPLREAAVRAAVISAFATPR